MEYKVSTERMIRILESRCRAININIQDRKYYVTAIGRTFNGEAIRGEGENINESLFNALIDSEKVFMGINLNSEHGMYITNTSEYR